MVSSTGPQRNPTIEAICKAFVSKSSLPALKECPELSYCYQDFPTGAQAESTSDVPH